MALIPDQPSIRFIIWGALHKDQWCNSPRLCNDHPTTHAPDCLVGQLDEAQENSHLRFLLNQILELDFRSEHGYHIDLDEIPADEFQGHRILIEERLRHEREEQERQKRNQK